MPLIKDLIREAQMLAAPDDSNPEYNRALVELISCFLPGDGDHVQAYVEPLISHTHRKSNS